MAQNITYISRFNQRKDYSGLTFGNITPTDIDSFLDFGNKVFIIIEFKLEGVEMPFGQQLAMERLVDTLDHTKPTIGIVSLHNTKPEDEIIAGTCLVEKYRYKQSWMTRKTPTTTRELIDMFLTKNNYKLPPTPPEVLGEINLTEEDYKKIDEINLAKCNLNGV